MGVEKVSTGATDQTTPYADAELQSEEPSGKRERVMGDERWRHDVTNVVNQHAKAIDKLGRSESLLQMDKQLAALSELQEKILTSAVNYTNLIIAAGYAGFFALWSSISQKAPEPLYSLSGLLIMTSLILFVSWEVIRIVWQALTLRKTEKILAGKNGPQVVHQFLDAYASFQKKIGLVWVFFLIPTVATGIGAGLCISWFFASNLWKAAFS